MTPSGSGKDKRDPGPLYPWPAVRDGVFASELALEDLRSLREYEVDPRYFEAWRDGLVWEVFFASDIEARWKIYQDRLREWIHDDSDWVDGEVLWLSLGLLGYDLEGPMSQNIWIFKRLYGLSSDTDEITVNLKLALVERLKDRGFLPASF